MKEIKAKFQKILIKRLIIGIILGAVGGYLYYYYIGCSNGTCPITSNPINTTLYGTLMGAVLFYKERKEVKENQDLQE